MVSVSSYRALFRELVQQNKRIYLLHFKDEVKKQNALLQYHRMNLLKQKKTEAEIDQIIKLRKLLLDKKNSDAGKAKKFINSLGLPGNSPRKVVPVELDDKVVDIVTLFLKSQRQYQVLVERYNPGMTMSQEDKVKKTARRVGLDVPDLQ